MFDVSHMCVVDLTGANTRSFLRGLLANNVDKLQTPGKALYACMLDEKGGVIDDLIVYFFAEDRFRLVVNASTALGDIEWIRARNAATGSDVTITPRREDVAPAGVQPLAIVAVQGPTPAPGCGAPSPRPSHRTRSSPSTPPWSRTRPSARSWWPAPATPAKTASN